MATPILTLLNSEAVFGKTPTGRQSEMQRKFEAAWRRAGGQYVLARSVSDALAALQ